MGVDCGCGGTCTMCSCVAGFMIPLHRAEIVKTAMQEGLAEESPEGQTDEIPVEKAEE